MRRRHRLPVVLGSATALGAVAVAARDVTVAIGGSAAGDRLRRMTRSPRYRDGAFHNSANATSSVPADQRDVLRRFARGAALRRPPRPVPVVSTRRAPATTGLHVTWFGHASCLVELDGVRVLLDPVWSERCSPSRYIGPRRLHAVPVSLAALGRVDAVVISHDHYDHLDMATVRALAADSDPLFVVPLGVGAHLEAWGISPQRVRECDWGDQVDVADVRLTAVEAQHFSGRGLRRNGTLWASWIVAAPGGRVFFSGDTGFFGGYARLGEQYGPFDASLMAVGAYDPAWHDIHLNPEEAVEAARLLRAGVVLPIHWCTFSLAPHPWAEPIERLLVAAEAAGVPVAVPRPGDRVDAAAPPARDPWWRS
ncbi:MAG: MBL fold metallo-hydrolase [Dermatophilaceae bacterium]